MKRIGSDYHPKGEASEEKRRKETSYQRLTNFESLTFFKNLRKKMGIQEIKRTLAQGRFEEGGY